MASGPITSWQIDRETMETVRYFIFLGSKITADGDYSHEIKRRFLLGRKAMTNLAYLKKIKINQKQRHYFADKGPSSQSYGFSSGHVWVWELDYKKKAEQWKIDAFELWCWRRLLRVPWTARRSNQSVLKEISPECSLEGLMVKLQLLMCFIRKLMKLQLQLATWCEGPTHWKRPWSWERLKAKGEEGSRGWDG